MCSSTNTFDYFIGGLGLISTLASIFLYYSRYLPGTQIKLLNELLSETKEIYQSACANGLLPIAVIPIVEMNLARYAWFTLMSFYFSHQNTLCSLEGVCSQLREQTYRATTPFAEFLALSTGLSRKIMQACGDVKKTRSLVLVGDRTSLLVGLVYSRSWTDCVGRGASSAMRVQPGRKSDPPGV